MLEKIIKNYFETIFVLMFCAIVLVGSGLLIGLPIILAMAMGNAWWLLLYIPVSFGICAMFTVGEEKK